MPAATAGIVQFVAGLVGPTAALVHTAIRVPPVDALYAYAVKPVMLAPPFDAGAFQDTVITCAFAVAVTLVGAVDGPMGVMPADAALAADVPAIFVAFTVNV